MKGPADLGGAHGFGPVRPDPDNEKFHAPWEARAFALTIAMGATGLWTLDASRYARETLPHTDYYTLGYFGIWLTALERLIANAGIYDGTPPPKRVLSGDDVRPAMARGGPTDRAGAKPLFAVGDKVLVKAQNPLTHTRAPAYLRGTVGTIVRRHGAHVFPDTNAHGQGENPTPLYTVRFAAADLWGPDTTAAAVHADLFEPYLAPA